MNPAAAAGAESVGTASLDILGLDDTRDTESDALDLPVDINPEPRPRNVTLNKGIARIQPMTSHKPDGYTSVSPYLIVDGGDGWPRRNR